MSYTVTKLGTAAECDEVLVMASDKKEDLQFEQTVLSRSSNGSAKSQARLNATLVSVNAQIAGFTASLAVLTDADSIKTMNSRIRKLNDRKDNLLEQAEKSSSAVFMENELELALLGKQIGEIDAFIGEVDARKAAL